MKLDLLHETGEECATCCRPLGPGLVAIDEADDWCCLDCARRLLAVEWHSPSMQLHDGFAERLFVEPSPPAPSPELVERAAELLDEVCPWSRAWRREPARVVAVLDELLHDNASTYAGARGAGERGAS